ncbi:Asp-tRNA(Asn)/Glu-tRNA(Gln) amidotransferase GatCAB subunit B, partial [Candidatus Bathyarchaeota archaeon]|nr:Asp-tRNA(Asn)/Glu-tRNA(Gln) amidotransferase GatCAB subunit B [Candidatus Bathyarchaeota archaeon]
MLVEKKGLRQISDAGALESVIDKVIKENERSVSDYKSGKKNALAHLVGQI